MNVVAALGAVGCAMLAATAAFADGALLSVPDSAGLSAAPADLVMRRDEAHRALTLLRRLVQLAAGATAGLALGLPDRGWWEAAIMALGVALPAVVLSESVARAAGDAAGASGLTVMTAFIRASEAVFAPVARMGLALDRWLKGLLPDPVTAPADREATEERFAELVAAEADVSGAEERVMRRAFSLGETEVREVMVPRVDIVGVEGDTPWSEVLDRIRASEHSRLPVYRGTVDDIIGVVFAKDLLPAVVDDAEPEAGWQTLVRSVAFYPPSKACDDLLREFRASGTHIAIVADEYGGTAGLVTIEDLLEELVGDIRDETDDVQPDIEAGDDGVYWVDGRTSLAQVAELTGRPFARDDVATVGGLVLAELGRVPRPGEVVEMAGWRLVVERVRRRGVARVYLEPRALPTPHEDDDL
jgi:putative hemolysin